MAVTAADGIFGFTPQLGKGSMPVSPNWYRHKATLVDLGVIDDQRVGQLEVGGGPFPTFPYKSGYVVGGGATIQPRLEDVLGWILYAGVGDKKSSVPVAGASVHAEITINTAPMAAINTALTQPPTNGGEIYLVVGTPVGATMTAGVTVIGTDMADVALTVVFTVTAKAAAATVHGDLATKFKTVTSITVNTGADGDKFTLKYLSGVTHSFVPKSSSQSYVRWMAGRKYIPMKDDDPLTDLLETYSDLKPLAMNFTLPNDSPIQARLDFLGRDFTMDNDIAAWSWANSFEDWDSIPVGCETDGYIKFTGGGLSGAELPVVAAQIGFVNTPLDLRQERVYGDPRIEDITVISRQMTYDCTVKWNNPELYRAVVTGNITGSTWSSRPLTGAMEVRTASTGFISGTQKNTLTVKSPEILWMMNGTPILAAGQAVIVRFTGIALNPTVGDYTTFELVNGVHDYVWPTA